MSSCCCTVNRLDLSEGVDAPTRAAPAGAPVIAPGLRILGAVTGVLVRLHRYRSLPAQMRHELYARLDQPGEGQ